MHTKSRLFGILAVLAIASPTQAGIVVDYVVDSGGDNMNPLNGLSARATFEVSGTNLMILLENTSTDVPMGFEVSDSLLVSLGMNMTGVTIESGNAAVVAPGSLGLGLWSLLGPGDSVAEEWLWTNDFGGDLMETFAQIVSTSAGQNGGTSTRFDGLPGTVDGPFGGIAASPPVIAVPDSERAVSNGILFDLTLTDTLTEAQLQTIANSSIVEFGSDQKYLSVPEPSAFALLVVAGALLGRRARRRRA